MNNKRLRSSYSIITISLVTSLVTGYIYDINVNQDVEFYEQAKSYHKGDFYFDTNPPLMKLFYSIIIKFYDNILRHRNLEKNDNIIYCCSIITYQVLSAIFLSLANLFTYKIAQLFCNNYVSVVISILLNFENYLHFSSYLKVGANFSLFFALSSVYFYMIYKEGQSIRYLYTSSIFISLGIATNLTFLFILLPILCDLLVDLFQIACDNSHAMFFGSNSVASLFINRLICVVLLPVVFYTFIFHLHLKYQTNYTNEASVMSLRFQGQLKDNYLEQSDKYLVDRSLVTLVNVENKVYIKSENKSYTKGSKQQVIFGEDYKDENSIWKIVKIHVDKEPNMTDEQRDFFIKSGDYIKLVHVVTNKYLHSHNIESENSNDKKLKEVSGYGSFADGVTDDNDFWVVNSNTEYVMTRISTFTLRHVKTGNLLGVRSATTIKSDDRHEAYSSSDGRKKFGYFIFEDNKIDNHHKNNTKDIRMSEKIHNYPDLTFSQKFKELNYKMLKEKNQPIYEKSEAYKWPYTKGNISFEESLPIETPQKILKLKIIVTLAKNLLPAKLYSALSKILTQIREYLNPIKQTEITHLKGNETNWCISFLVFLFPVLWIVNRACSFRGIKICYLSSHVVFLFFVFIATYFFNAILSFEESVLAYDASFVFSLIISGYLIGKLGDKFIYVLLSLSISSFCRNICPLLK